MNVTLIQGSSFTQGYLNNSFKEQQSLNNDIKIEESKEILDHRKLSNEETKNLYLAYQTNNLMKQKIEIDMRVKADEHLDYEENHKLEKPIKRIDAMRYNSIQSLVTHNDFKYEVWAE